MKVAITGLLFFLPFCLPLSAQQASLSGVTADAVTQTPLPRVHVSLISPSAGTNLPGTDDAYGAISDATGHYSIDNIRPGTYVVRAQHNGYLYARESETLSLKATERRTGYRIPLTPEAIITGRVIDEFGDPVQGAEVRALTSDTPSPASWRMRAESDDRGEYRISGLPGTYLIEVSVHPLHGDSASEIRTDGSSTAPYATTYYPGALAKERAKAVEAAAGRELTGIDVHVAHRRNVTISGVVTGLPAGDSRRATVTINVYTHGGQAQEDIAAGAEGRFSFANLAPAEYYLHAELPAAVAGGDALISPSAKVTVENDDAVATLPLSAGEELPGTLRLDGMPPGAGPQWVVRFAPEGLEGTPTRGGVVSADGSFTVSRIIPGKFRIEVDPLPENAYVSGLLINGIVSSGLELDLSKGTHGVTLEIPVRRDGGSVTGLIAEPDKRLAVGRGLFVVLAADTTSFAEWRTMITSDSTFAFRGVRPGKYRLFAIDPAQFGGLTSYEPLKAVAARAEEIDVQPGGRIVRTVQLAGKGSAGAN